MKPQECPSFDHCDAPLCPLDEQSLAHGIWYPDEAICTAHGRTERFLAMQRRIARKTADPDRGYFTVAMLSIPAIVGRAIKGLSPDSAGQQAEARWITRKRQAERSRRSPTEAQLRARAAFLKFKKPQSVPVHSTSEVGRVSEVKPDVPPEMSNPRFDETPRTAGAGR